MPKVSIIMPTYNVEKYFNQCIESVINQTLTDIEIIPVDDGSPDNCGKIMDQYAQKDSRIKPIHQPNGGYGKAVNVGIAAATGEYIGIVETDDFCELDMFEKLYLQAKKLEADVCKGNFNYYYGNDKYKPYNKLQEIAPEGTLFTLKNNPKILKYHVSIWSAIYKKSYLDKYNIRVEESKSASYQDMPFAVSVYAHGATITVIHDCIINYRAEENMNSSTIRTDGRLKMMPIMCQLAKQTLIEQNCWEETKEIAYWHFYNCSVGMFFQTDLEYKPAHFKELKILFGNMYEEKCKFELFTAKEKRILNYIIKNKYNQLVLPYQIKQIRRKFISIRWNKKEKSIKLFGKKLAGKV